jgi:hypothetical protein
LYTGETWAVLQSDGTIPDADTHNILYSLQRGFRTGRSCETQLLEFIDDVTLNMENGKQTDILVMDFSKAFDKFSHSLLLHKLHYHGIQGELNSWIQKKISNRKQAVVLEGMVSSAIRCIVDDRPAGISLI